MKIKQVERAVAYAPPRNEDFSKLASMLNTTLGTREVRIVKEDSSSGTRWILTQAGRRLSMPCTKAEMTICVSAYIAGFYTATQP